MLHKWLKRDRNHDFYDIPLNPGEGVWAEGVDSRLHTGSDRRKPRWWTALPRDTLCPFQVFPTYILNSMLCCPLEFLSVISEDSKRRANLLRGKQMTFSPLRILPSLTMWVLGFVLFLCHTTMLGNSQEVKWVSYNSTPLWNYLLRDSIRIHRTRAQSYKAVPTSEDNCKSRLSPVFLIQESHNPLFRFINLLEWHANSEKYLLPRSSVYYKRL